MMTDLHIRPYAKADLDAVADIWTAAFGADAPSSLVDQSIAEKERFQPGLVFVAEINGRLVGTIIAGYDGYRGWLNGVAVHPDYQRRGIAREMVHHAIAKLQSLGCLKVNLQIRDGNEAVVAFYETLGFDVEQRISMGKLIG